MIEAVDDEGAVRMATAPLPRSHSRNVRTFAGARAILAKPCNEHELLRAVTAAIG